MAAILGLRTVVLLVVVVWESWSGGVFLVLNDLE